MRPESISPSKHDAGLQHPSVPMRWHWSCSVGASSAQSLQLGFVGRGGKSSLKDVPKIPYPCIADTAGLSFLPGDPLRCGAAHGDVGNQTY